MKRCTNLILNMELNNMAKVKVRVPKDKGWDKARIDKLLKELTKELDAKK